MIRTAQKENIDYPNFHEVKTMLFEIKVPSKKRIMIINIDIIETLCLEHDGCHFKTYSVERSFVQWILICSRLQLLELPEIEKMTAIRLKLVKK